MKKLLSALLALTLLLALTGCGSSANTPTEAPKVTSTTYGLYGMVTNGVTIQDDELDDMLRQMGMGIDEMYVILRSDGTGTMSFLGQVYDICYDETQYWRADNEGLRTNYQLMGEEFQMVTNGSTYLFAR